MWNIVPLTGRTHWLKKKKVISFCRKGRRGIGRNPKEVSILYKKIKGNYSKMLTFLFFLLYDMIVTIYLKSLTLIPSPTNKWHISLSY